MDVLIFLTSGVSLIPAELFAIHPGYVLELFQMIALTSEPRFPFSSNQCGKLALLAGVVNGNTIYALLRDNERNV